jgi:hypothetical protein
MSKQLVEELRSLTEDEDNFSIFVQLMFGQFLEFLNTHLPRSCPERYRDTVREFIRELLNHQLTALVTSSTATARLSTSGSMPVSLGTDNVPRFGVFPPTNCPAMRVEAAAACSVELRAIPQTQNVSGAFTQFMAVCGSSNPFNPSAILPSESGYCITRLIRDPASDLRLRIPSVESEVIIYIFSSRPTEYLVEVTATPGPDTLVSSLKVHLTPTGL